MKLTNKKEIFLLFLGILLLSIPVSCNNLLNSNTNLNKNSNTNTISSENKATLSIQNSASNSNKNTLKMTETLSNKLKTNSQSLIKAKNTVSTAVSAKIKARQIELMTYFNNLFKAEDKKIKPKQQKNYKEKLANGNPNNFYFKAMASQLIPSTATNSTTPNAAGSTSSSGNSTNSSIIPNPDTDMLQDWLMISSFEFLNTARFPPVILPNGVEITIKTDRKQFRLNDATLCQDESRPPTNRLFWFRLSGTHLYYSATSTDINILGVINIRDIQDVDEEVDALDTRIYCFTTIDTVRKKWKVCSDNQITINIWVCRIKYFLKIDDPKCRKEPEIEKEIIEKKIIQPLIIIPLPSPKCNENWNYQKNGDDWECDCSEGREQSPIDLPKISDTIDSPIKPLFSYEEVDSNAQINTIDQQMRRNEPLKIKLINGHFQIFHNYFGKAVTLDGAVYFAEEITIHTPSNHKLDGKQFALELSVIHYGQTKGDIAKQIVLSFLFDKVPGSYNKFFDDLDFFNLPNPVSIERDIYNNIFIPKVFYKSDLDEFPIMKPFSFYTYQGSIPFPPCTERSINYVASEPIPLSSTVIELFKEALRVPDLINHKGDVIVSDWINMSNRNVQDPNGRPIFHYDHIKYCGPDPPKKRIEPVGHYEKVIKKATQYFYVNGEKPSGLPGAFVVSEKEAKGKRLNNEKN